MFQRMERVTLPGMPAELFHPAVAAWFRETYAEPSEAQRLGWPAIGAGKHTLIAAPTGSGKTLAAFLSAIDGLVRDGVEVPIAEHEARLLAGRKAVMRADWLLHAEFTPRPIVGRLTLWTESGETREDLFTTTISARAASSCE